jgi:folate-binding protein YgfZ
MAGAVVRDTSGDPRAEYHSARTAAALFDLSGWTQLEVSGSDRAKFLHNFCTNDVRGLAPGQGCEALVTNVQGKVLAHLFVYARHDALELLAVPGSAERIVAHLSRYQISEDVAFHDLSAERSLFLVAGPQAAIALANAGESVQELGRGKLHSAEAAAADGMLYRNDFLGLPGFLIASAAAKASDWSARLADAGAVSAGVAAFEALRIEAGFPLYGIDASDANLAQELSRTAQAISFSKGCYLGQEPIARIDAMGHVNQQLRGIRLREGPSPAAGAEIFTADPEARKIGQITSSAVCPETGLPVALGYLKRHFDTAGMAVHVAEGNRRIPGELFWPEK